MNRFKETLEELRQRPGAKLAEALLLPDVRDPAAQKKGSGSEDGDFKLPYSSDPDSIVEPWK